MSALVSVLMGTLLVAGRAADGATGMEKPDQARYVVRAGETLWELAREAVGQEGDPRALVDAIREINGLRASRLIAGEELLLPFP